MSNFASVEAEQAVLGSMLIDSGCVRRVAAILRESDFSVAFNRELYRVIVTMDRDGQPIDGLTVCAEALRQSLAEEKTLRKCLVQLMEITPTAANVEMYADIVARAARRRELKTALEDGLAALADQAPEDEVLAQLDAAMTASSQRLESELLAPKEQVDGFLDYRAKIDEGNIPYVRTGIKALDKLLGGGMVQDGLYILAGRDIKLVVVDHFGLILRPGKRQDTDESREIAHALKRLAQSLNQPVLCLAQLNRQNEQRTDKRPTLADLRATGAMEEDADGVIFVHRPDYYQADYKREQGAPERTEVILAKNRHGSTGRLDLSFWPETNTFNPAYVE